MSATVEVGGKTYPMVWAWLPASVEDSWDPQQTGTVIVTGGAHAGTYQNTPVYEVNGVYWVWPNAQFSGYAKPGILTKIRSTVSPPSMPGKGANILPYVAVASAAAGFLVYLIYAKKAGKPPFKPRGPKFL